MKRIAIAGLLVLCMCGCTLFESGAKATAELAWDAAEAVVKAKIPVISAEILAAAKVEAMGLVDKGCEAVEKETLRQAETIVEKARASWGVDVSQVQSIPELLRRIEEEQNRRQRQGEDPLPWYAVPGLLGALASWQVGKSAKRALEEHGAKKACKT